MMKMARPARATVASSGASPTREDSTAPNSTKASSMVISAITWPNSRKQSHSVWLNAVTASPAANAAKNPSPSPPAASPMTKAPRTRPMPYSDWYSGRMWKRWSTRPMTQDPAAPMAKPAAGPSTNSCPRKPSHWVGAAEIAVGDGDQDQQDGQDHDVVGASLHTQAPPHRAGEARVAQHVAQHHRVGGGQDRPQPRRQDHGKAEQEHAGPGQQPGYQQRGRPQNQQRRQPVPAQLGELQVDRVQEQHQREGHDGHGLQQAAVQADGDEPEAAVADHEAQTQKQHRERQGSALDQPGGQRGHNQDPGDQPKRSSQVQRGLHGSNKRPGRTRQHRQSSDAESSIKEGSAGGQTGMDENSGGSGLVRYGKLQVAQATQI